MSEEWRAEIQDYALLLDAVAGGDRSKVIKLLADYLLSNRNGQEREERLASGIGSQHDAEDGADEQSRHETKEDVDEIIPRKRVRFADESGVYDEDEGEGYELGSYEDEIDQPQDSQYMSSAEYQEYDEPGWEDVHMSGALMEDPTRTEAGTDGSYSNHDYSFNEEDTYGAGYDEIVFGQPESNHDGYVGNPHAYDYYPGDEEGYGSIYGAFYEDEGDVYHEGDLNVGQGTYHAHRILERTRTDDEEQEQDFPTIGEEGNAELVAEERDDSDRRAIPFFDYGTSVNLYSSTGEGTEEVEEDDNHETLKQIVDGQGWSGLDHGTLDGSDSDHQNLLDDAELHTYNHRGSHNPLSEQQETVSDEAKPDPLIHYDSDPFPEISRLHMLWEMHKSVNKQAKDQQLGLGQHQRHQRPVRVVNPSYNVFEMGNRFYEYHKESTEDPAISAYLSKVLEPRNMTQRSRFFFRRRWANFA